jgi:protein-disulfide isomerase
MTLGRKFSASKIGVAAGVALFIGATLGWFVLSTANETREEIMGLPAYVHLDEIQHRVRASLTNYAENIVDAAHRVETRRIAAEQDEIKNAIAEQEVELLRDPSSPVGGNPRGDVALVEFSDYNCPYCRRVAPLLAEAEASDPMLRLVYKEVPILGPDSLYAAKAALAAHRQGKYVAFHRALMDAKGVASEGLVLAIAARIGLDVVRLKGDIEDPSIQAVIDRNLVLARTLGITGTPSFVIGDEIVRGAVDLKTMQTLVRQARTAR